MENIKKKIVEDVSKRYFSKRGEHADPAMYIEGKVFEKGAKIDVFDRKISVAKPAHYVFIDEQPGMNWGHACQHLLYDAKEGKLISEIDGKFPPFLNRNPSDTFESLRVPKIAKLYKNKRMNRIPLEPAKLTGYKLLGPLPFKWQLQGNRYAIMFSGSSNCRHVNDFEFLYRTLLDVYGFNPGDIYVCNHDGNVNWNISCWDAFCEPAQDLANPIDYPVDGTPFRLQVNEHGTRTGFQNAISQLATRIGSHDCLYIFTNNHGWYSTRPGGTPDEGYMSTPDGEYWAEDFVADLSALPRFRTLLAVMEQCSSGSFIPPVINGSPADKTVIQTAVPEKVSSAGGWFFDPWIELWISAMAGVRGDSSALAVSPDDNLDSKISAYEAFDFALSEDDPQMQESSTDLSKSVFLSSCCTSIKLLKEFKEFEKSGIKEMLKDRYKEVMKEFKEFGMEAKMFTSEFEKEIDSYVDIPAIREEQLMRARSGFAAQSAKLSREVQSLSTRITALEKAVNKLTPFIKSNVRPDIKGKAFKDKKK